MDVRRRVSRIGSLSIILVLSLAVLAACGREENAKPTATPTGGAAVGTIEAPSGTIESGAAGAEGTVEAMATEANAAVEGTVESDTGAVQGSVEAASETVQAEPTENGGVIGAIQGSVEAGAEVVPIVQRRIIGLCRKYGKLSIVATQMMASMVDAPFPPV